MYKRHALPLESCFENAEYDIMKRCWKWQRSKRITFPELKEKLGELHDHAVNSGNCDLHKLIKNQLPHIISSYETTIKHYLRTDSEYDGTHFVNSFL